MALRVMTRRQRLTLRVHTEWQPPLSGVHSIMMEKLAQVGEGEGCTPTPFHYSTITYKVVVFAPAEWADTLTLFHLYQYMYSVGSLHYINRRQDTGHLLVLQVEREAGDTKQSKETGPCDRIM